MNAYEDITLFDEAEETTAIIDTITISPRVKESKLEKKTATLDFFPMNAFFSPTNYSGKPVRSTRFPVWFIELRFKPIPHPRILQ